MHISFDLDSTLIPVAKEFETEKRSRIAKASGIETIRKGTSELISVLQNHGHTVHIYTTSFRSRKKILKTLKYYGIKVGRIVSQEENQRVLRQSNISASKYPKAFGFDLHIDDSKGVAIESKRFNFEALIIEPTDKNWIETIKTYLKIPNKT